MIWLMVKFWPPTDSTGGFWLRSTLSTTPCTWVEMATFWPLESTAVIDIV